MKTKPRRAARRRRRRAPQKSRRGRARGFVRQACRQKGQYCSIVAEQLRRGGANAVGTQAAGGLRGQAGGGEPHPLMKSDGHRAARDGLKPFGFQLLAAFFGISLQSPSNGGA
ncbi:hypothetical protein WS68_20750 [Burkholderia sp. TSV86]|nr:hypothetical protein WS68_20750 [Burkholderia sp. TSV86]